jgi:hypothetical protein
MREKVRTHTKPQARKTLLLFDEKGKGEGRAAGFAAPDGQLYELTTRRLDKLRLPTIPQSQQQFLAIRMKAQYAFRGAT